MPKEPFGFSRDVKPQLSKPSFASVRFTVAAGQNAQTIHSSAYEDHRRYYYQEARVTRLIGYLYLQVPNQPFSDDQLSTVNWAVF